MVPAGMRLYKARATDAKDLIFTLALVLCALQHQAIILQLSSLCYSGFEAWFHDRDTQLTSAFWKSVAQLLGVKQCLTSARRPQSDA